MNTTLLMANVLGLCRKREEAPDNTDKGSEQG